MPLAFFEAFKLLVDEETLLVVPSILLVFLLTTLFLLFLVSADLLRRLLSWITLRGLRESLNNRLNLGP